MKLIDKKCCVIAESYGDLHIDDYDDAKIISVQMPEDKSDLYTVTIEVGGKE